MKPVLMGLTAAAIAGAAGAATAASPLSRYVDQARVLVVSAPTADNPDLRRQDAEIGAQASGLRAHDLVVVRAIGSAALGLATLGPQAKEGAAAEVRSAVGLPAGRFGVALVGKDGGVKLRRREPISMEALFGVIDAMPMRRKEMRRAGPG